MIAPALAVMDEATADRVIEAACAVLEVVGVSVEDEQAAALLEGSGTRSPCGRIRIPALLVRHCLESAPKKLVLHDRNGNPVCELGSGEVHFAPGSAALNVHDSTENRHRPARTQDVVELARLTESLARISLQSTGLIPSDTFDPLQDKLRLLIALTHGTKPVITGTFREDSFVVMKRMLTTVRQGEDDLAARPIAIFDCCPTPPLGWSRLSCRTLVEGARAGIPIQIVSMPMAGATAPVTITERLIQHTAENLSGLVLHQLAHPGSPVVFGGAAAACDMRLGTTPTAGMESILMGCGVGQVGRRLGLPTQFFLGVSDSKCTDWQAGVEAGLGILMGTLCGVNLVTGLGMLDFIGCLSLEKLYLDDEICGSLQALRRRTVERPDEGSVLQLMRDLTKTGQLLGHPHTRRHFREALHVPGPAFDRSSRAGPEEKAAGDTAARSREEVRRILSKEPTGLLDDDRRGLLARILSEEAARLGLRSLGFEGIRGD